jgi:chromosome segregation ATPase
MVREHRAIIFLVAAALGVWGCAKATPQTSREAERIKFLEAKVCKLEEDFRTAAAARDLWKSKAVVLEQARGQLQKEIPPLLRERNELRSQVAARSAERDAVQGQYDSFRREIRNLLGHADANAGHAPAAPVSAANAPAVPARS